MTAIGSALDSLAAVSMRQPPQSTHIPMRQYRQFAGPYLGKMGQAPFMVMCDPRDWPGGWHRYRQRDNPA